MLHFGTEGMRRICSRVFPTAVICWLAGLSSGRSAGQANLKEIDVCQVIASDANLNGQYLSIHGVFNKDLEHTDITGADCKQAIAIRPTDASKGDPGFQALLAVFYCPPLNLESKRMSGDFVGHFEWLPGQNPRWVLHLDRVYNLHIVVDGCGLQRSPTG